ncbi:DUF1850 domain-containing protein [Azospirillum sp. A39]|uniref:DUF1850 domain-containing protein n=1 Tax=Azospirillum sp. A39 TaxID=3462279 RepID=UPI00404666E7
MSAAVCIATLGGALLAALPGDRFTLSWTHSIEKVEWQEDWRVADGRLAVVQARVKGSGAGMEPGEGAHLIDGWWTWRPEVPPQNRVVLAASSFTSDHQLCVGGDCRPLHAWTGPLPGERPLVLRACP